MQCLQAARAPVPATLQHEHVSSGSSSGRCPPPCQRPAQRRPCSRRPSRLHAAVVGDGQATQQQQGPAGGNGAPPPPPAAAQQQGSGVIVAAPEDFQLPPGQLSHVERSKPLAAADAFRCAACTRPECQVRAGRVLAAAVPACRLPHTCAAAACCCCCCQLHHSRKLFPLPLQTPAGCAAMQWRSAPGGYLREVLTAKVYDVAVETPLERMDILR